MVPSGPQFGVSVPKKSSNFHSLSPGRAALANEYPAQLILALVEKEEVERMEALRESAENMATLARDMREKASEFVEECKKTRREQREFRQY